MARTALERLRALCLALPDTVESPLRGRPHFRVGGRIFAGLGDEPDGTQVRLKLERKHADALLEEGRLQRISYAWSQGWVVVDTRRLADWTELGELVKESYRLVAPELALAKLAGAPPATRGAVKLATRAARARAAEEAQRDKDHDPFAGRKGLVKRPPRG